MNDPCLTWIDGQLVDSPVPLGQDEVELAALAERAPLRVDNHVFLLRKIKIEH